MNRFFSSILLGLMLGAVAGLYLGWEVFPVEYRDSAAANLDQKHKDAYTVMIAAGYLADNDVTGAVERLRILGVENAPQYVMETTERFITNSAEIEDIRYLVALAEGLGRFTPIMEPYRTVLQGGA